MIKENSKQAIVETELQIATENTSPAQPDTNGEAAQEAFERDIISYQTEHKDGMNQPLNAEPMTEAQINSLLKTPNA